MAREPLILGVDCSTHGAKAIAWTLHGEQAAAATAPFDLLQPRDGWYEQRAVDWRACTFAALREVSSLVGPRVAAIGVTHQRETFVGVGEDGEPVRNAIVWMDERSTNQVDALRRSVGDPLFHHTTGKPLSITPSISKIMWIREHEPEAFRRVEHWFDVGGYLVRALTGENVSASASAESMGLVDLEAGRWNPQLLAAAGLEEQRMARLVPAGTVVGGLCESAAKHTRLPKGLPVVATAGDGQVAAAGAGVLALDKAYLNLGTAIVSGTVSRSYRVDRAFRTMGGALPGTYLYESDLKGGTFTLDWLTERLLGHAVPRTVLEAQAADLPPGAEGLVLVPYWCGVMNPYWDDRASGILVGLRGQHGPAHIYRAILEGIAFEQHVHLREIERATGVEIREVRVLGGGAASPLWCAILADVLGKRVVRTRTAEATSLGAAMIAATAMGLLPDATAAVDAMCATAEVYEPGPASEPYRALFDRVYQGLFLALQPSLLSLAMLRGDGKLK